MVLSPAGVRALEHYQEMTDTVERLHNRLDSIVAECRNETSGAEEDRARDAVLATIIALAEGRAP